MRYLVKQKYFTIADRYYINDENGNPRFMVKSKFFTLGKKFWICTTNEQELFYLKQRLFRLLPRYDIYQNEQRVGYVKVTPSLFVKRAKVVSDYGDFKIKGNVFAWDFKILQDKNEVVNISKHILKIADTYTVDIARGANDPFMLAVTIIMDALFNKKR